MKHILLTRPLDDSLDLMLKFRSEGFKISHLPLIKIKKLENKQKILSDYDALIFTSSNAIKHLDIKNINKNIYCFCVGSATEKTARSKGFTNTFSAGGNVLNLKEIIIRKVTDKKIKFLYVSGEMVSHDLNDDLKAEGFLIKSFINYTVVHNDEISQDFLDQIKKDIPDAIFIYSQNSAKSFLNLSNKYGLNDLWMNTNLMCLGEKTSSELNNIKWKKIYLFNPGEEEFLLYKI